MKDFFYRALAALLKRLAILTLWRFRPGVIGVTGSAGKTSTKMAIAAVMGGDRSLRYAKGNMNNELGLPLAILGDFPEEELALVSRDVPAGARMFEKAVFWPKVIVRSLCTLLFARRASYPELLVLEYGADRPGDIKELVSIARPGIGVITAIGEIPVHVEFYGSAEEVAREKSRLIEFIPAAGYAIVNYDDPRVMMLRDRTRANIMTYGFHEGAQVRVSGFEHRSDAGEPTGISFKLEYGGSFVPVRMDGVFGKANAYAAAAGACAGLIFGMNLVKISEALSGFKPPHGRAELKRGIRESFIIDDSYNASVISMQAGLHTLADLPAKRRVAILGDMLELGTYSMEAHERIGRIVPKCVDVLVTVGSRAKLIAETVRKTRFPKRNMYSFATVDDARATVPDLVKKGDLILVKGSRAMKLDEIVDVIVDKPAPEGARVERV